MRFVDVIEPIHMYQRLSYPFTPLYAPEELAQQAGAKLEALVCSPAFASLHAEYEVRVKNLLSTSSQLAVRGRRTSLSLVDR